MTKLIKPATPGVDQPVDVLIDVGQVPHGHGYGGQFVITLQIAPFKSLSDAKQVERVLREIVSSRLGLKFTQQGIA